MLPSPSCHRRLVPAALPCSPYSRPMPASPHPPPDDEPNTHADPRSDASAPRSLTRRAPGVLGTALCAPIHPLSSVKGDRPGVSSECPSSAASGECFLFDGLARSTPTAESGMSRADTAGNVKPPPLQLPQPQSEGRTNHPVSSRHRPAGLDRTTRTRKSTPPTRTLITRRITNRRITTLTMGPVTLMPTAGQSSRTHPATTPLRSPSSAHMLRPPAPARKSRRQGTETRAFLPLSLLRERLHQGVTTI